MQNTIKKPELLAPAGNLEKLKMAILYGADAVYLGGKRFGLRAYGGNFSKEEMIEGVKFAHERGRKVYVTANIFPHNNDINEILPYLQELVEVGVDAVLVSDIGLFMLIKNEVPNLEVHISTQANNTNWRAVKAWQDLGAERVVLARELSFAEIKEIREKTDVELEMFVHGAMCISYSGRCLISNYLTGRDSNRGACTQPCRWKYNLTEEKRPGQFFPVTEDENGTYAMVYVPVSRSFRVNLKVLKASKINAWWYNPRNGKAKRIGTFTNNQGLMEFTPPYAGELLDWVLVLDDAACKYPKPGERSLNK